MNIVIPHPERVEKIEAQIKSGGFQNLHILSDFDRTLTYGAVDGVKTPSIISMLRDGHHLADGYAEKAHTLFNRYHPVEVDPNVSLEEKKKAMQEWWETHNKLLIESGLSYSDLEDIVQNGHVRFRDGVADFLDLLHAYNIPLVIFSASGCGDAVRLFFLKMDKDYSNIFYVINQFHWDSQGKAISTKGPLIHTFNKDETTIEEIPEIYLEIHERPNVILLGDSTGDVGMVEGFTYSSLLKIGFLNSDTALLQKEYEKNFDIILEGDGDFEFINTFIYDLAKKKPS